MNESVSNEVFIGPSNRTNLKGQSDRWLFSFANRIKPKGVSHLGLKESLRLIDDLQLAIDRSAIVTITDLKGEIVYANQMMSKVSKYPIEELIGKKHSMLNSGYHSREFFRDLWSTLNSGNIWKGEIRDKAKDGSFFWLDTTIVPFMYSDGKAYQYVSIRTDITEKKAAMERAEMERAQRVHAGRLAALGEMSADIAHEIRNPLNALSLNAQLLKLLASNGHVDPSEVMKLTDKIVQMTSKIDKIITGLGRLSRKSEGDLFEKADLVEIIRETFDLCEPRFRHHSTRLILDGLPIKLEIKCRPGQLSQVLVNLINNAFDAIQKLEERWVRVQVKDESDLVTVSVIDSGSGIPHEISSRLMEPFFTSKPPGEGTGLGLSISRSIVESHGGKLELIKDAPNTTFVFTLPNP